MNVFLYEFMTGGGWLGIDDREIPPDAYSAEGAAMLSALASDFAALPRCDVEVLLDARLPCPALPARVSISRVSNAAQEKLAFGQAVKEAEGVLLIAPEFDRHLLSRAQYVESMRKQLLSPSSQFVEIAGDKWELYQALHSAARRTPRTWKVDHLRQLPATLTYPLVAKPRDGCGSHNVRLIRSDKELEWRDETMLVQEYRPGIAASVALLCGPAGAFPLPACTQVLSDDGLFTYYGGGCPLSDALNARAQALALDAVEVLPPAVGYVGVDLVLGDAEDGSQDYVIEINPRLTTSYVGLRVLSKTNLAQAMLDVAQGREPQLARKEGRVRWSAGGAVEYLDA